MERDPHQLIEGALICAYAIRASQVFLYVRGEMALAQERIADALNEAYAAGYVGRNICGSDWSMDVTLHWGAGAYIVGDETALLESLAGRRGMPRPKPPYFPAVDRACTTTRRSSTTSRRCPTCRGSSLNGGEAFAALGSEKTNGTRMFAVSGHVKQPGHLRGRVGQGDVPRHVLRPAPRRRDPRQPARSRRSSPAAGRRRGSSRSTSTCPSTRRSSAPPARCSARAPSS